MRRNLKTVIAFVWSLVSALAGSRLFCILNIHFNSSTITLPAIDEDSALISSVNQVTAIVYIYPQEMPVLTKNRTMEIRLRLWKLQD